MSKSLNERRAKAEAELAAIQKEEEELARYKNSLIAKVVIEKMKIDTEFDHQITVLLDEGLKKQRDRQLFDLPRKLKQAKAAIDQETLANDLGYLQHTSVN